MVFCYSSVSGQKKIHFGEIEIFYIIIRTEFLIYIFLKAQQIVHLKLVILLFVNYFSIGLIVFVFVLIVMSSL